MLFTSRSWKSLPVFALSLFLLPAVTQAQHYTQKNLVSDISQPDNADKTKVLLDQNLKNPWGLTRSPGGGPWWVGNNNSGTSTIYSGAGTPAEFLPDPPGSPFNNFRPPDMVCPKLVRFLLQDRGATT